MGSDESSFNVLLIVRDEVTRQCPQTTTFEEKGEPKQIPTEVPLITGLTARLNRLTGEVTCVRVFILTLISLGLPERASVESDNGRVMQYQSCLLLAVLNS